MLPRAPHKAPLAMKILIIRLSAIGDTIHSLPVAAALKRNLPGLELSWLVEPLSEPLLRNNPAVDKVYVLRKQEWLSNLFTTTGGKPNGAIEFFKLVQELRAQKFDIALDLQGLFKSAVFLGLSNATRSIGLSDTREGASFFIKEAVDVGDWFAPDIHIVDRSLAVADYIIESVQSNKAHTNVVEFPLPAPPAESTQLANKVWETIAAGNDKIRNVVLIPGSTWVTKLWAPNKWCELVAQISKGQTLQLCLVGTALEHEANSFIESTLKTSAPQIRVINLTGQTGLLDLVALFNRCDLVIGADTGPLHLAAATGHPIVVGVYGSSPRVRNGPYGPHCHTVALDLWCQPCSQKECPLGTLDCLKQLPVDTVLQAVKAAELAQMR
jgi:lipopolysaccharide heptosyltransferase I